MPTKEPTENHAAALRALGCACSALLLLSGCASAPPSPIADSTRDDSFVEYAGSSSELVFSGLGVQGAPGFAPSEKWESWWAEQLVRKRSKAPWIVSAATSEIKP